MDQKGWRPFVETTGDAFLLAGLLAFGALVGIGLVYQGILGLRAIVEWIIGG